MTRNLLLLRFIRDGKLGVSLAANWFRGSYWFKVLQKIFNITGLCLMDPKTTFQRPFTMELIASPMGWLGPLVHKE